MVPFLNRKQADCPAISERKDRVQTSGARKEAHEAVDDARSELVDDTLAKVFAVEQKKKDQEKRADKKLWPKIVLKLEEATVVERLRARKLTSCIRVIEEVNKEALENYPDKEIEAVGCERKATSDFATRF